VGVEAGGLGLRSGRHAVRLTPTPKSRTGVLHGYYSYVLQNSDGQIANTHSVSAGLDYSGVGPEHAWLHTTAKARYTYATDAQTLSAFKILCEKEGIIPALESAHAVAYAAKRAPQMSKRSIIIVNLSGRGDKDIHLVADCLNIAI
jgi:tryptophan synthase beta chain